MYGPGLPCLGTFSLPTRVGTDATADFVVIPPFLGVGGFLQSWTVGSVGNAKTRSPLNAFTHVVKMAYTTGDTSHLVSIMRPLNFTVVASAVAANGTVITVADDPGVYSTNYKYPIVGGVPAQLADNPIATNDYIVVQLADGTWIARKVTVSGLALTVSNIPNGTGAIGIAKGALCYFMGIPGDANPADGQVHPSVNSTINTTRESLLDESFYGAVPSLHAGDPMLWYSPHTVHKGTLEALSGFYSDR